MEGRAENRGTLEPEVGDSEMWNVQSDRLKLRNLLIPLLIMKSEERGSVRKSDLHQD